MLEDMAARCDAIEECYEFMLAYAAQGLADDRASPTGAQLRELLARAVQAATGLAEAYAELANERKLEPVEPYENFLEVLGQDAARALAVIGLVLAQPRISSQLIDNLNASIHVRTLLTDMFLIDEVVKIQEPAAKGIAIEPPSA